MRRVVQQRYTLVRKSNTVFCELLSDRPDTVQLTTDPTALFAHCAHLSSNCLALIINGTQFADKAGHFAANCITYCADYIASMDD